MPSLAKQNPYYRPLQDVWRSVVALNGVLFQFTTHIRGRRRQLTEASPRGRGPMAAASLVILDLTAPLRDGWPRMFPIGGHMREGKRYVAMLDELTAREAVWTVAHGFEAFEASVVNTAALYLKRNPSRIEHPEWRSRRRGIQQRPASRRLEDYRTFVLSTGRSANGVVSRLGASLPALESAERQNYYSVDLSDWLTVAAAVRHATVHEAAVISKQRLEKLGPARVRILTRLFPGRATKTSYRLTLDRKTAEKALEMFAAYAFLVYKSVSNHDSLNADAYLGDRIDT